MFNPEKLKQQLNFLKGAEALKDVLRSAHTTQGKQESTAEHSWHLCLMALTFENELQDLDLLKVFKLCLIHDLGEAISGDIPAIHQSADNNKLEQERLDFMSLIAPLETREQERFWPCGKNTIPLRVPKQKGSKAWTNSKPFCNTIRG